MPRKKTEEPLKLAEQTADLIEEHMTEDDPVPSEAEEDFSLSSDMFGEGPEDDVPEPDMEDAPDFLSGEMEVISAAPVFSAQSEDETAVLDAVPVAQPEYIVPETDAPENDAQEADGSEKAGVKNRRMKTLGGTKPRTASSAPSNPGFTAEGADRRAFFGLDFHELDRNLSERERQEWNNIYASYRGHSVMSGKVAGVNPHDFRIRDNRTGEILTRKFYCAVVIPFRVPILIPETELWFRGEQRPRNVTRNLGLATVDFVITQVDRQKCFVVASRRLALASRRYYFSTQPQLNRPGTRLKCNVMTVGNRQLLASCHGYDVNLTQRELDYTAIPDLKKCFRRGDVLDCIVKEYNSRQNHLVISVKESIPNPFIGADFRHPLGCSRQGLISGKYGGGVFCNLTDGVTVMCNYSFQYTDSDFLIGDSVTVVIQRFDYEKKQVYGKIVAKE